MTDRPYLNAYVDGRHVVLVSRNSSGRIVHESVPAEYAAFFKEADMPRPLEASLLRSSAVVGARREPGGWVRVQFADGDWRRQVCFEGTSRNGATNPLIAAGIEPFEADVDPVRRWLSDSEATIAKPRRCFLDLETDSRVPFSRREEMRILSWAVVGEDGGSFVGSLQDNSDGAEADLLGELWDLLGDFDQTCAWNGGEPLVGGKGFDFPLLLERSQARGLRPDARRMLWVDHLQVFRKMNLNVAESGEEKQSMRLNAVAQAVLGEGKEETPAWVSDKFGRKALGALSWDLWREGGKYRALLLRYMLRDADLLRKIEQRKGYLDVLGAICQACNIFPNTEALAPTRQMDGFLLRFGRRKNIHFPSRKRGQGAAKEKFKGAFVLHPRMLDHPETGWSGAQWRAKRGMRDGILEDVHVADFSGMYPSIMVSFNMSPDARLPNAPVNGPIARDACRCPTTGVSFRTDQRGLLIEALLELMSLRKQWTNLKDGLPVNTPEWRDADGRSMGFKVAANALFGALGNVWCRFYDRATAESITQNGAWLIHQTIAAAEERGFEVAYSDTDSLFVVDVTREQFAQFVAWCNKELYPKLLAAQGCKENRISIAYEKAYSLLAMTAAKRYVAKLLHYKGKEATGDSKIEVKGLEYKRGDASALARELQRQVAEVMMSGQRSPEHFHAMLSRARQHVMQEELPIEEILISKGLNKPLKEYAQKVKNDGTDAAQPPHVMLAKLLKERGRDVSEGTRVDFVVLDDEATDPKKRFALAEDFDGRFDRHYVWESLVYPPTGRLLAAAFPEQADAWDQWARSRPRGRSRRQADLEGAGQVPMFGAADPARKTEAKT